MTLSFLFQHIFSLQPYTSAVRLSLGANSIAPRRLAAPRNEPHDPGGDANVPDAGGGVFIQANDYRKNALLLFKQSCKRGYLVEEILTSGNTMEELMANAIRCVSV